MIRSDQMVIACVFALYSGVAAGSFFVIGLAPFLVALALSIAIASISPRRVAIVAFIMIMAAACGNILVHSSIQSFSKESRFFDTETSGIVRVVADPEERGRYRKTILRFESCGSDQCPSRDILWQAPRISHVEAGDRLMFSCRLSMPKAFSGDFDYRMFLAKDGVGSICEQAHRAEELPRDIIGHFRSALYIPKHIFEHALEQSLPEPESGLAQGLILGGDTLSEASSEAFRRIGLTHVIAVSGYNISIIMGGCFFIGIAFGLWRHQALMMAIGIIALFVLMIGAPASAVRAGFMAAVGFLAIQAGRPIMALRALFFAGAVMTVIDPLILRYDVGFQLSFLATLGVINAASWMEWRFPEPFFGYGLLETAIMTLFAEIFVLPLIALEFETFSPIAFLANIVLLPAVPYAMGLSFLTGIVHMVLPGMQTVIAWCDYAILSFLTRSAEYIAHFSWASIDIGPVAPAVIGIWYVTLISVIIREEYRKRRDWYDQAFKIPYFQ